MGVITATPRVHSAGASYMTTMLGQLRGQAKDPLLIYLIEMAMEQSGEIDKRRREADA